MRYGSGMDRLQNGTFRTLIRFGAGKRRRIRITTKDETEAKRRELQIAEISRLLARACVPWDVATDVLDLVGQGQAVTANEIVEAHMAGLTASKPVVATESKEIRSMNDLARAWMTGELAKKYPDCKAARQTKRSGDDENNWKYIGKTIGLISVKRFTLEDAELAMRKLPEGRTSSTRRRYALLMTKLLRLAVYPLKLIKFSPVPPGFLPARNKVKAKSWLYPDDDRQLLACTRIPIDSRVLYGFLGREGMRCGEALSLQYHDFGLTAGKTGVVMLDKNKTDTPRTWALTPGTAAAIRRLKDLTKAGPDDYPFRHLETAHVADDFRGHLKLAEIDRPEMHEQNENRLRMRLHDLRSTFVTISLANGKTETWVRDRSGHKSSEQINTYRQAARMAEELELGAFAPLDQAIDWKHEAPAVAAPLAAE